MEIRDKLTNKIQCGYCNDIVYSFYRHNYKQCKCGKSAIDGGWDYVRVIGDNVKVVPYTIIEDIKIIRNRFKWTKNYDKNDKLLPKSKRVPRLLRNLTTDHIIGILSYFNIKLYERTKIPAEIIMDKSHFIIQEIFIQELSYRNQNNIL